MQTKNKKQIFVALIAVLISVGLVAVAVYATTTVGDDVSVGGDLDVGGALDVTATTSLATTTASGSAAFNNASLQQGIGVVSEGYYRGIEAMGTGYFGGGTTTGACGKIPVSMAGNGEPPYYGACLGYYASSGPAYYGLLFENTSSTLTMTDIYLQKGATIDNTATGTISFGSANVTTTGSVAIGGGTAITKHISATSSLDFGAIGANACETQTMTVTGVADGDVVTLGVPHSFANASSTLTWSGWASTTNTVAVRVCQVAGTTTADFAAAVFRADGWKH